MNKIIGKNIKKAREELGISQKMLSELLGYKSSAPISLIEDGKSKVSVENLHKISLSLGNSMEWYCEQGSDINCHVCKDKKHILCYGEYINCVFCNKSK